MNTAALPTIRWSQTIRCPRQAFYQATNTEPDRQRTDRENRILFRGIRIGQAYADWIAHTHGEHNIIREKPVRWPGGTLHTDVFFRPTSTPIEVLSSASPSSQIDSKLLQLAGQIHYDPDADDVGILVLLNPVDFSEERVTLKLTDEWSRRVEEAAQQVIDGIETGCPPRRVCRKPSEAIGRFCVFADTCFEGWEPEPLEPVEDQEVLAIARQLYENKRTAAVQRQHLSHTEASIKELQAELGTFLDPGEYQVGPLTVVRSRRSRESFNLKSARAAGMPEPMIREHSRLTEFDVWTLRGDPDAVDRSYDDPDPEDDSDVAPF